MNATAVSVTADAATQLVVTSQPPTTVTAGIGFGLAIAAEDQYGNVDPAFVGSVTVALASNPGGSTLGGTTNLTFSNGLANFSGLTLDEVGSNYTLEAASSGLAPATFFIPTVTAAATQLVVTSPPPATVTAGSAFGLVIAAEDQYGNVDTAFDGSVTVALADNPGGSTLGGTTVVSFSNGLATFAGLTLDAAGSGYTFQAASSGLAPPTSSSSLTLNVMAAAAAQLVVTSQPPATVFAGEGFGLTVAVEDAFGNPVTDFNGNLAVAPASSAVEGSLGGALTVPVSNGVATFTGLSLDEGRQRRHAPGLRHRASRRDDQPVQRDGRTARATGGDLPAAGHRRRRQRVRPRHRGRGSVRQRDLDVPRQRQRDRGPGQQPRRDHAGRHDHRDASATAWPPSPA